MSEKDILQNMISELGQSQDERTSRELDEHYADVDERAPEDQLARMKALAAHLRYYRGDIAAPDGNWAGFFPDADDIAGLFANAKDHETKPHLALWMTFLHLLDIPREALNRITGQHRDYHYQTILGFEIAKPVPDRAHVIARLKPKQPSLLLGPQHELSGGKDAKGVELVYSPVRDTIVSPARVTHLCSVLVEDRTAKKGRVRFAPIANSADGLGAPLPEADPKWPAFGHDALPDAKVGFAVAAPVLRMAEGTRKVTLAITLAGWNGQGPTASAIAGALQAYVTGPKGWIGPLAVTGTSAGSALSLVFELGVRDPAVVDHDPAIHGGEYSVSAPVVQLFFAPGNDTFGYKDVRGLAVGSVKVTVAVDKLSSLALESDAGKVDPKKVFLPFGPTPVRRSRLMIGCPEALSKKLSALGIHLKWQGLPVSLDDVYATYATVPWVPPIYEGGPGFDLLPGVDGITQDSFTATVVFDEAGDWQGTFQQQKLFGRTISGVLDDDLTLSFSRFGTVHAEELSISHKRDLFERTGMQWAKQKAAEAEMRGPGFFFGSRGGRISHEVTRKRSEQLDYPDVYAPPGFVTIALDRDFLHQDYRRMIVERTLAFTMGKSAALHAPLEPYTPAIQSISLSYDAYSDAVDMGADSESAFATEEVQFFHIGCLGVVREHRYSRGKLGLADTTVYLVPTYTGAASIAAETSPTDGGELWLGLADLTPGQSVSLLFQVAEGSADPELPRRKVAWSVLREGHFQPIEIALDTTNNLVRSGLVVAVVPMDASTTGTLLPSSRIWLRAAVEGGVASVCQLVDVEANGVEVRLKGDKNDPAHLAAPLPKGSIAKLKTPVSGVKTVTQPFASFGGRLAEAPSALATRASERLRHKDRCVTAWDYERIVLSAFPEIHRVKCVPHAGQDMFFAPGHVLLVVVPDLTNQNAKDRLRPKVDADTLVRIHDHLAVRAGMQTQIHVQNPRYQEVKLTFKVQFQKGLEYDYHATLLNEEIQQYLSPWAFEIGRDMPFGGRVHRSTLLDFIETRPYVDYVTSFQLSTFPVGQASTDDVNEALPERPDAILVSSDSHSISPV